MKINREEIGAGSQDKWPPFLSCQRSLVPGFPAWTAWSTYRFGYESVSASFLHKGEKKLVWKQYLWEIAFKAGFCISVPIQKATKAALGCFPSLLRRQVEHSALCSKSCWGEPRFETYGVLTLVFPCWESLVHILLRHPVWRWCLACSSLWPWVLPQAGLTFTTCPSPAPTHVEERNCHHLNIFKYKWNWLWRLLHMCLHVFIRGALKPICNVLGDLSLQKVAF